MRRHTRQWALDGPWPLPEPSVTSPALFFDHFPDSWLACLTVSKCVAFCYLSPGKLHPFPNLSTHLFLLQWILHTAAGLIDLSSPHMLKLGQDWVIWSKVVFINYIRLFLSSLLPSLLFSFLPSFPHRVVIIFIWDIIHLFVSFCFQVYGVFFTSLSYWFNSRFWTHRTFTCFPKSKFFSLFLRQKVRYFLCSLLFSLNINHKNYSISLHRDPLIRFYSCILLHYVNGLSTKFLCWDI